MIGQFPKDEKVVSKISEEGFVGQDAQPVHEGDRTSGSSYDSVTAEFVEQERKRLDSIQESVNSSMKLIKYLVILVSTLFLVIIIANTFVYPILRLEQTDKSLLIAMVTMVGVGPLAISLAMAKLLSVNSHNQQKHIHGLIAQKNMIDN